MKQANKKIVIVTSEFPPQPGGIGTHAFQLSQSLYEQGFPILVISDQRSMDGMTEMEFDNSLPYKVIRVKRRRIRPFMYLARIYNTLKNIQKTYTVIATGKFSLWNVAFCKLIKKFKSIAVIHGSEVNLRSRHFKKLTMVSLNSFDEIIAVSNYTKSFVSGLNREINVIPNGIFHKDWTFPVEEIMNLKGFPKIITVGRLSERKGQLQMIKHLPSLINSYPDIHYHCIGIDNLRENYLSVANKLGVLDHVSIHGVVDSSVLKDYLCAADIFVMLSKEDKEGDIEGFGIAILEANASGIAAIGSTNSGIEDTINNDKSGILVTPEDSGQVLQAINKIMDEKQSFEREAKNWAKKHDWEILIQKYVDIIR